MKNKNLEARLESLENIIVEVHSKILCFRSQLEIIAEVVQTAIHSNVHNSHKLDELKYVMQDLSSKFQKEN